MTRTPQRDVNMANRLLKQAEICITAAKNLTGGEPADLKHVEESMYDTAARLREHRRKHSPIEIKGQRT